jgi:hypothetical protein
MKIRPVGAELLHVDGQMDRQTDRQTDIRKLLAAFRNFANAPKKSKDAPVYTLKAYRKSRGTAAFIRNVGTRRRWVNFTLRPFYPRGKRLVLIKWEAGWTSDPVWTFRRRDKSPSPAQDSNLWTSARSLVTKLPNPGSRSWEILRRHSGQPVKGPGLKKNDLPMSPES